MMHCHDARPAARRPRARLLLLVLLLSVLGALPAAAQVPGISYTLSPLGSRVFWSDDAGLSDDNLYGGEVGLGFGEFLEFGGLYLTGSGFETDFSKLSGDDPALLAALARLSPRDVRVQRYGGKLRVNLGAGGFVPFLTAGTGILRFDPDGLDDSENIYVNAGAGLTFSLANRYTLSVAAENLAYRFNVGSTFFSQDELDRLGLSLDNFNQQTVYNPAVSASLKIYLGGRGEGELTDVDRALVQQFRRGDFRLAVEPFYGQIEFADELGFPSSQALVGVHAGFDLGPYVGIRGFYWQATEEENVFDQGPTDFTGLSFYGAELDLRLDRQLAGLTPYLMMGGGYMSIDDSYEEYSGVLPDSRYFAIGGVGLEVAFTSSIKLQGAMRGLFMSTEDVADVSDPSGVHFSPMYTLGINFNISRPGRTPTAVTATDVEELREGRRTREADLERQLARLQARLDSLEAGRAAPPDLAGPVPSARLDTVGVRGAQAAGLAGRTMTIPIPEEGEIYVRFGSAAGTTVETVYAPPAVITGGLTPAGFVPAAPQDTTALGDSTLAGRLTAEQVRLIVRQTLAEQQQQAGTTEQDLRAMEERLEARITRETNRLRTDLARQPDRTTVVAEGESDAETRVERRDDTVVRTFQQRELEGFWPMIGVREGEGPEQFLVGARLDYTFPGQRYHLVPELAFGFSDDGVALSALGNVTLPFAGGLVEAVQPYVGAGAGLVTDSGLKGLDLALNLMVGTQYSLPNGMTFFGEYGTLDFFDFNRLLFGYRLSF